MLVPVLVGVVVAVVLRVFFTPAGFKWKKFKYEKYLEMFEFFKYKLGSLFHIIKTLEIHNFNYITPNSINNMYKFIRIIVTCFK